jgi:hypothetical protein
MLLLTPKLLPQSIGSEEQRFKILMGFEACLADLRGGGLLLRGDGDGFGGLLLREPVAGARRLNLLSGI